MGLRFCSFASGSTGNSYLVRTDNTAILVDCGIAGKRILGGLDSVGLGIDDVNAILITHEHSDHIQSIRMMAKKAVNADVLATPGTIEGIGDKVPSGRMARQLGLKVLSSTFMALSLSGMMLISPFMRRMPARVSQRLPIRSAMTVKPGMTGGKNNVF